MNELKDKVNTLSNLELGEEIIKNYHWFADHNRKKTIDEICVGVRDNEEFRTFANLFIDFQEKKISELEWNKVRDTYKHLI